MWLHVCSLCPPLPVYDPLYPLLLSFPAALADPLASHVCVALPPHPLHPSPPSPTQPTRAHPAHPPPARRTTCRPAASRPFAHVSRPFRIRLDNLTVIRLGGSTNVLAVYVDPDNGDRGGRAHGSGWWCEGGGL